MAHKGMKFGIFLAPFHRIGENPTLALGRDMELIEWLDVLGYDEVWVGEHHSAGWELIASPEVFIAAAAERTRHIMLGSGVTSLPYHHPFLVAQRFVQLDHMTRGRAMLGCGPGALVSDAYMLGIEPVTQRPRMDEALDAIMRLLACDEPVTMKTDWFELRDARLHLAPYTEPHFPIAVASTITPAGVTAAGRHGLGVLSLGAGLPGGPDMLANQWKIAEETAAQHGKTMDRKKWRLVVNVHVADDDAEAMRQVKRAERHETVTYFEETLGRPPGRSDDPLTDGVKMGTTLVGSVDTVVRGIEHLWKLSAGGFGGLLVPGPRVGQPRADAEELRAVRPLRHAALPGLAGHRPRIERLGPGQPEDHLQPQRGGRAPGLPGRRPRDPRRVPPAHLGRPRSGVSAHDALRPVRAADGRSCAGSWGRTAFPISDWALRRGTSGRAP